MPRGNDVLLYENPYYPGMENPRRRRHHRRNPNIKAMFGKGKQAMFGGLDLMEMLGAVGGFALSAMVPGYIIKEPLDTELKKAGKVALALAFAFVAKMALGTAMNKPGIGRAAMYGGFAGTGALALKIYAPTVNVINAPSAVRRVGPVHVAPTPAGLGRNTNEEFTPAAIL
jgi:hypothetical protein